MGLLGKIFLAFILSITYSVHISYAYLCSPDVLVFQYNNKLYQTDINGKYDLFFLKTKILDYTIEGLHLSGNIIKLCEYPGIEEIEVFHYSYILTQDTVQFFIYLILAGAISFGIMYLYKSRKSK
ncbi:hypothetical protein LAT59_04630 [Candidatus Gracilibacteria bacterium]|nr:hypothetical protein [Candidatus Gracilibacteria bacterium]